MTGETEIAEARDIMLAFADRTGLSNPEQPPQRYLWTDAHAVCTFLSLYGATRESRCLELALALIDQVHGVLGRHRDDDPRDGWISGLGDEEGRAHPTAGGLRIGKPLNERRRSDPVDERLEWEQDGQYFHYLTKWMHALCRAAAVTGHAVYLQWAGELAAAAYAGFAVAAPGGKRLAWKMSIDLSYPLVALSGHHDPLDGYITFKEIASGDETVLGDELAALGTMLLDRDWATIDPLGIGGLLFDANRVVRLTASGRMDGAALAGTLVAASGDSLAAFSRQAGLDAPADYRLAFRELGLSLGLRAVDTMRRLVDEHGERFGTGLSRDLHGLRQYVPLADNIEAFWRRPGSQQARTWLEHEDINAVTLATSLLPDEFLKA